MAEQKITEASVLSLVAKHKSTASRGAELLAMSIWDFYDLMHDNGIALGDETPQEMKEGVKALNALLNKQRKTKVKKW